MRTSSDKCGSRRGDLETLKDSKLVSEKEVDKKKEVLFKIEMMEEGQKDRVETSDRNSNKSLTIYNIGFQILINQITNSHNQQTMILFYLLSSFSESLKVWGLMIRYHKFLRMKGLLRNQCLQILIQKCKEMI